MKHIQAELLVRSGGLEKVTGKSRCPVNLCGGMLLAKRASTCANHEQEGVQMTTERLFGEDVDVSEAVIRVVEEEGADVVFGVPGGYTVKLYDALYDHTSNVRAVLVREESLAGVMAEVYGRFTGRPAVVMGQGAFLVACLLVCVGVCGVGVWVVG
ncbi:MAG: thiamine pyrophosphate-binding protein, partial [Actinomycetia bacterium]|nr:thiamine pyrophosphate-binding protein [Actinomycetes bacterium]